MFSRNTTSDRHAGKWIRFAVGVIGIGLQHCFFRQLQFGAPHFLM